MKVLIPSALHSYTGGSHVEACGATVADVLEHLDWTGRCETAAN